MRQHGLVDSLQQLELPISVRLGVFLKEYNSASALAFDALGASSASFGLIPFQIFGSPCFRLGHHPMPFSAKTE